ncbi:MAG: MarR family transcriptional regulator [Oscillospiraceae bacterium]|nr:MarR family transcriptional regulator [Oscillospiraceae bacterium]
MQERIHEELKLENQLCFPLYACSREVIKKYRPFLDEIGLTYTQYVAMMVFWEQKSISVKELGQRLYLDSGTLTPVLKSLEGKGYVTRRRSAEDERVLIATLTDEGAALQEAASRIPAQIGGCIRLEPEEAVMLYQLLYKLLHEMN